MLKRRLIPKLQLKSRQLGAVNRPVLVTTVGFERVLDIGDPVSQAKIYEAQAADELVLLDLDSGAPRNEAVLSVLRRIAQEIFMPFTVGGGVRTVDDFRVLLSAGADKVCINTAAVADPGLIDAASQRFGTQCVVLSIDYRQHVDGRREVFVDGGRRATGLDAVAWATEAVARGAGEILLTSIERDGSRSGLDVELIRQMADAVAVPVIAAGGCGIARHFVEGFVQGGADAVASGTFFSFKDQNPMQTRAHIKNAGIPIRIHL